MLACCTQVDSCPCSVLVFQLATLAIKIDSSCDPCNFSYRFGNLYLFELGHITEMPELNLSPRNGRPGEPFDRHGDFPHILPTALRNIGNIGKADEIGFRFDQFGPGDRGLDIGNSRSDSILGGLCFTYKVQADGAGLPRAQNGIITSRLIKGVKVLLWVVVLTRQRKVSVNSYSLIVFVPIVDAAIHPFSQGARVVARAPWRAPYGHLTKLATSALVVVMGAAQDSPCMPRRLGQNPAFSQRVFDCSIDFLIGVSVFHGACVTLSDKSTSCQVTTFMGFGKCEQCFRVKYLELACLCWIPSAAEAVWLPQRIALVLSTRSQLRQMPFVGACSDCVSGQFFARACRSGRNRDGRDHWVLAVQS